MGRGQADRPQFSLSVRFRCVHPLTPGILHLFYTVWDYIDERVFDKPNTSDCTEFAGMLGWTANSEPGRTGRLADGSLGGGVVRVGELGVHHGHHGRHCRVPEDA